MPLAADPLPFPASLCHRCAERRYVETERSLFLRCRVLPSKYPPQPVHACALFQPLASPT